MKSIFKKLTASITVVVFISLSVLCYAENYECSERKYEDINIIKDNILASEIEGYLPGDVYNTAKGHIDSMNKYGYWDDIDYSTPPGTMFYATQHINRLMAIARAYIVPNQPLFHSSEAMDIIEKGLPIVESKILKQKADGTLQALGNWWFWNLYIPPRLGFVLLVAEGNINDEILNTSLKTYYFCLTTPYDFYLKNLTGDGANSTNAIKGNVYYAVLTKNEEALRIISDAFVESIRVVDRPLEGIREDGSYIQHIMIDYYQYFVDFVNGTISIQNYLKNSKFAPKPEEFDSFAGCVCDGAVWAMYQENRDLGASGRMMSGPFDEKSISHIISALKLVADNECSYQQEAQMLLDKYQSGIEMKTGHKYFYQTDYTVHKTNKSYVSLKMSSPRAKPAEAWSGQGNTTLFASDGYMQIYDDAEEYFGDDAISCMDWTKLAGITILRNHTPILFDAVHYSAEPFTGGTSNGDYGVSAMSLSQISMPLYAHKSWFFFDDEVVCLGSGIESDDDEEVHTYIDERPERGGGFVVNGEKNSLSVGKSQNLSDVSWITNNGIGYYFPQKVDLCLEKESREGSWKLLNSNSDPTVNKADFSYLWFNHGSKPEGASYAYAVLPSFSDFETKKYAEGKNFEILEQSDKIHAVYDYSTNTSGMVFWPENNNFLSINLSTDTSFFDGIFPRAADPRSSKTVTVEVDGIKGRANAFSNYGMQGFAASEQRAAEDVDITITWFDDRSASSGSWWYLKYTDSNGQIKCTETIPYTYTDEWKETVFHIEDIKFDGTVNGEAGVEFAVVHSGNAFNSSDKKYNPSGDSSSEEAVMLYGPIIHRITIYPHNEKPQNEYSASVEDISVDCPCIVYKKPVSDGMELYITEPTQQGKTINLTVDGTYTEKSSDENVSVHAVAGGKTQITVKCENGRTYKIALKKD